MGGAGVASSLSERSGRLTWSSLSLASALALAGCAEVGPDYQRPSAPVAPAFKELKGWKAASPRDEAPRALSMVP